MKIVVKIFQQSGSKLVKVLDETWNQVDFKWTLKVFNEIMLY